MSGKDNPEGGAGSGKGGGSGKGEGGGERGGEENKETVYKAVPHLQFQ